MAPEEPSENNKPISNHDVSKEGQRGSVVVPYYF